ncbi:5'-methylthioadenosine/adenosylhomocysteine nucleosidase [Castellaniella sp. GW247-6E4]|uniref:5'-methylthioadenosine/adenosylhomocysteine nucleosidase n=1 Tax=Castellaniella sp. GW247-6E4 TaxID=3140380 RepID=UPI00331492BA
MTIGILAALREEASHLLADLEPGGRRTRIALRDYTSGTIHGHDCVIVLARIGKVAAATTATALIEHFGVDRLIFTGVAGGVAPGLRIGDVVIADTLVQHDLDARPFFPRHEIPLLDTSHCAADPDLTGRLETAAQAFLDGTIWQRIGPDVRRQFDLVQPRVHRGLIASGDQFIGSATGVRALREALPDALAVEMEGAAVAQVCHEYGIPFAVMRTVSDTADDQAHRDFPAFLGQVASHYAHGILQCLFEAGIPPAGPARTDPQPPLNAPGLKARAT